MFLLPAVPYTLSTLYVEVIRGIPMLVTVLYMGFAVTPTSRTASGDWLAGLSEFTIGKVAIARALAMNPKNMLFDEPTSSQSRRTPTAPMARMHR